MEEVLDPVLGGDESEAAVRNHLLDRPRGHLPTLAPGARSYTRLVGALLASLSPYSNQVLAGLFDSTYEVEVLTVPAAATPGAVRDVVAMADLVLGDKKRRHPIDRAALQAMRRCRLIQQPAVGFDAIDHRAAAELGIPVANAAGYNREAVADWTVMAVLNLLRQGALRDRRMREGQWPNDPAGTHELGALTVGVVGVGHTGAAVVDRLRGFGSRLLFSDVVPRNLAGGVQLPLQELLEQADVVTVHVPLDIETRGLIDAAALGRMKKGAILVNASRGPVVEEMALIEALQDGRLAGAALDVFELEPLDPGSPLRKMDNVFLSPHVAGVSEESEARLLETCAANMRRVLDGLEPFNVVNGVSRRS
jgi:phosphoglycerate dehydrogenase-like enzyme